MNTLIERKLQQYPSSILTEGELACLAGGTPHSRYARNKRAVQKGDLIRIKRGLYVVNKQLSQQAPSFFELAQRIYGPSYISFESALSYHGLIPEAVYSITSATTKRTKIFETPLGHFSYISLPNFNFFIGVAHIKEGNQHYLLASPWKALLDYIYCYTKKYRTVTEAAEDLRLDVSELPKIAAKDLEAFELYYQNTRINQFIKGISEEYLQ